MRDASELGNRGRMKGGHAVPIGRASILLFAGRADRLEERINAIRGEAEYSSGLSSLGSAVKSLGKGRGCLQLPLGRDSG